MTRADAVTPPLPVRVRVPLTPPQAARSTTVEWWPGADARGARGARPQGIVLAHGAGSDLDHPLLRAVAGGLAGRGHPVCTFNFAYAEAGRRRPDPMPRLEACFRAVLAAAHTRLGADRPLLLAGRSMGGRVASHLAAAGEPCAGLALLGYPLHPPGRPDRLRSEHWPRLQVPVLFVSGDRDPMCPLDVLAREIGAHLRAPSDVHVLSGADHGFDVRVRDGRDAEAVRAEAVAAVAGWAARLGDRAGEP